MADARTHRDLKQAEGLLDSLGPYEASEVQSLIKSMKVLLLPSLQQGCKLMKSSMLPRT
jgi:hypothetical protein